MSGRELAWQGTGFITGKHMIEPVHSADAMRMSQSKLPKEAVRRICAAVSYVSRRWDM